MRAASPAPCRVEMRILILHGMIHLAGFDHETDDGKMDRLERRLRSDWELPDGWELPEDDDGSLCSGVSALGVGLVIFSYLDRIYRELGRVTNGTSPRASRIF